MSNVTEKHRTEGKEQRREMMMRLLPYKVIRGTCLRFPEQFKVVITGDVLQQRLPANAMVLEMIL